MGRVENKVAVVTGGSRGIGEAIVRRLAGEGAKVVITDVEVEAGRALAAELGCDFLEHDVTSEEQWTAVIDKVKEKHKALHILVNNAGIASGKSNSDTEHALLADWQAVMRVNVEGVFLGCRAGIPLMRESGGGAIINMSSIAALKSNPDNPSYGASKAAVRHLTKSTAVYCAENGSKIRCNSVHPGLIRTPMLEATIKRLSQDRDLPIEQVLKDYKAMTPTGELLEPEDIANAVLFLVSDDARQITGAQLVVDGGLTAK